MEKDKFVPSNKIVGLSLVVALVLSYVGNAVLAFGQVPSNMPEELVGDLIIQSIGSVFVFPLLHIMIASIWKSKRNGDTRKRILFGWSFVVMAAQLTNIFL